MLSIWGFAAYRGFCTSRDLVRAATAAALYVMYRLHMHTANCNCYAVCLL